MISRYGKSTNSQFTAVSKNGKKHNRYGSCRITEESESEIGETTFESGDEQRRIDRAKIENLMKRIADEEKLELSI